MKFDEILEACWKGYHKEGMKTMFGKRYPNCVKNKKSNEDIDQQGVAEGKRIARKPGQPAGSKKHSDLYTDENPRGTITGLKFATVTDARDSVAKIRNSGRSHAHKIQAAVAMEQRARAAGKASVAAVYRAYINANKKTNEEQLAEKCWDGYRQQGTKNKGGRQVPNCVPVAEVKTGPEITGRELLFKAAAMAMLAASQAGQSLDYEQAIKQASKMYGIPYQPSELPRLLAQRAEIDRQLALLKQGKQVAKQRRQEKRAPTPAGAEEYWRTHALPTDRIKPATKSLEEAMDPFLDNAARELLGLVIIAGGAFAVGTYYTILNKLKKYQGRQIIDALESKGVTMNHQTYEQVKPLLNQFRQALKDDEGEQAKMLAKRVEQMIVMGKLSAPEPQVVDTALAAKEKELAEDLKKWFKEKWVRFGPDGKIRGDCARGSSKEGKPKCLPQSKAQALGKKGRASAAAKKRREDPDPERRGPAKNVATKVREAGSPAQQAAIAIAMKKAGNEPKSVTEGIPFDQCPKCGGAIVHISMLQEKQDACYHKVKSRYKVWPSAYASGALVQCRKKGAANWGTGAKKK
jgi:hypothetical protein